METEFNGIERRLDELNERLARLNPLAKHSQDDFVQDPYLRDIVERNLEVAAQCCIDIANRIISLLNVQKPSDCHDEILRLGELGILPPEFALRFAPIAGFRYILVHEYLGIDWNQVFDHLQNLDDLVNFSNAIQQWLEKR